MNLDLLNNLHQTEEFKILLKELHGHRPILPNYDPKLQEVEMWKFRSAQQQHHDMLLQLIDPFKKS
jgi:hypothetical protein